MFDSPFEYCMACRSYVLLDQTCRECAREHACAGSCPLAPYFTGIEMRTADTSESSSAANEPLPRTPP